MPDHQTEVTVTPDGTVMLHDIDPGILGIVETVGTIVLAVAFRQTTRSLRGLAGRPVDDATLSCMDQPVHESPSSSPLRLPWDFHPALQLERLRVCARLLANARRDAIALARTELGDDAWSVGCRAYAFGRQRLQRVAEAGTYAWLRVLDESHHFVFLIEQVPVRFYRGQADDPIARTLRRQEDEARQLALALGGDAAADGLVSRLAVETDAAGGVGRVVFLALRGEEGHAECIWPVPLEVDQQSPGPAPMQLRLIADDGYQGPGTSESMVTAAPPNVAPGKQGSRRGGLARARVTRRT